MNTTMQSAVRGELAEAARELARLRRHPELLMPRWRPKADEVMKVLDADWQAARDAIARLERSHGHAAEAASHRFADAWSILISRLRTVRV